MFQMLTAVLRYFIKEIEWVGKKFKDSDQWCKKTYFYLVEVILLCLQKLCKKSLSLISSNL